MSDYWYVDASALGPEAKKAFINLKQALAVDGEHITDSKLCVVVRAELDGRGYYLKRYRRAGTGLGEYLLTSKARMEWQNLRRFAQWGIPVAKIVACGEQPYGQGPRQGVVITQELEGTKDLKALFEQNSPLLRDRNWVWKVTQQLAKITATMHSRRFAHNDLKWRNILVNTHGEPRLFLIDCPSGRFWWQPFFTYRRIKDLACLDKVAKYALSGSQRLRFYKCYKGVTKLTMKDKREISRVLSFFQGRE